MKVVLTRKHLEGTVRKQTDCCPMARYWQEQYPGYIVSVTTGHSCVWSKDSVEVKCFVHSDELQDNLEQYDQGGDFQCGVYEVYPQ